MRTCWGSAPEVKSGAATCYRWRDAIHVLKNERETSMIYVVAELRLKPGTVDKAVVEARKVVAGTVKEDGCIFYDMHRSIHDPDKLVVVERWASRAALDAHMKTPHLRAWRAAGKEFIADRKVEIITPEKVDTL